MNEKKLFGDITIGNEHPALKAAEARAEDIVKRASLNEAIRTIEELEKEVATMTIASRFSKEKGLNPELAVGSFSPISVAGGTLDTLPEAERKREALLLGLRRMKNEISAVVSGLKTAVMDIEATKTEG